MSAPAVSTDPHPIHVSDLLSLTGPVQAAVHRDFELGWVQSLAAAVRHADGIIWLDVADATDDDTHVIVTVNGEQVAISKRLLLVVRGKAVAR